MIKQNRVDLTSPAVSCIAVLMLLTLNANSQQLLKTKTFLNHQVAEAYSCQLWSDTLYVALEGGVVAKLDSRLNHAGWADDLRGSCIVEVFESRDALFARSYNHELFVLTKSRPWRKLAQMDCYQFLDSSNTVHILKDRTVYRIEKDSDDIKLSSVIQLSTKTDSVTTFAIVGDTVIVSLMNSSDVFIQLVTGEVLDKKEFWKVFEERYFAMSDGSIFFLAGGEQAGWFRVGATEQDRLMWYAGGRHEAPSYTRAVFADGKVGIAGSRKVDTDSAIVIHLYKSAMLPDTVSVLGRLHTYRPIAVCHSDSTWACASSFGRYAIASANTGTRIKEYFPYMWKGAVLRVSHIEKGEPAGSGSIQCCDFDLEPAVFSTEGTDTVEFPTGLKPVPNFCHTVYRGENGSEVIIFNNEVWYRSRRENEWESKVAITCDVLEENEVQFFPPSTIITTDWFARCDISTDNGITWRTTTNMKPRVYLGEVFAAHDYLVTSGNSELRYFKLADVPGGNHQGSMRFNFEQTGHEFLSIDSSAVRFIALQSRIDTTFPSLRIDRFVLYTWSPRAGVLDSHVIMLDEPIKANNSGSLFACEYRDTVNLWLDNSSRFLRIANGRLVFDTTLDIRKKWPLAGEPTRTLLTKDGVWWIVYGDKNIAFGFDVSHGEEVVSVTERFSKVSLTVYPIPATTVLQVCIEQPDDHDSRLIEIMDIEGRVVKRETAYGSEVSIDISPLPTGLYSLLVRSGSTIGITAFVVSH